MWNKSMQELIGNTPLVQLNNITKSIKPTVLVKLELFNPLGSIKDRIAFTMIHEAEKRGDLVPNGTIVEMTSGNTGVGIAWQAALKGYKAIIIGSERISPQKEIIMKALGAQVIKCKTYDEQVGEAAQAVKEIPNSFFINQLDSQDNVAAHYDTTGPEIWEQTEGKVEYVVAGIGSGGTASGVSKYLKEKNSNIKIIGIDGEGSIFYNYFYNGIMEETGSHNIEGIGNDKIQKAIHFDRIDEIISIPDDQAYSMSRRLLKEEGIFAGASSGAIVSAALQIAENLPSDKIIVAILPDIGYTYLNHVFNKL